MKRITDKAHYRLLRRLKMNNVYLFLIIILFQKNKQLKTWLWGFGWTFDNKYWMKIHLDKKKQKTNKKRKTKNEKNDPCHDISYWLNDKIEYRGRSLKCLSLIPSIWLKGIKLSDQWSTMVRLLEVVNLSLILYDFCIRPWMTGFLTLSINSQTSICVGLTEMKSHLL